MALSLPSERSVAAGSQTTFFGSVARLVARWSQNRKRRTALKGLMEMDSTQLRDLGISRADIADALKASDGRTPGMILSAARARNARS